MFGLFEEKLACPSCSHMLVAAPVRISRFHEIKVFNCPGCKADYVRNKRSELYPILDEGAILC